MLDKIQFILKRFDYHTRELVRGAFESYVLRVLAAVFGFTLHIVLARQLKTEGVGVYFLALTLTNVATVFGQIGLNNTLVRFTSSNAIAEDWEAVKGLYKKGTRLALIASGSTAVLMALNAQWIAEVLFNKPELTSPLRWMAVAVVPSTFLVIHTSLLRGLKRIRDAMLVGSVFVPLFSLPVVMVLVPFWGVQGAVWAFIVANILTLLIALWRWHAATPQLQGLRGHFKTSNMLQSSIPLFWVAIMNLIISRSSIFLLGIWGSSSDVGIFGVANRTAMFTSFVLVAVNSIAAPKFSAFYRQGEMEELARAARNSAKLMVLMATPLLLLFLSVPGWVMSIFGQQFSEGAMVLAILGVGQFINVATGAVGCLLVMCGYERIMLNNMIFCASFNLVLNFVLIPYMGAIGAAIATATTLAVQNLIAAGLVWLKLEIMTIPIFWKRAKVKA